MLNYGFNPALSPFPQYLPLLGSTFLPTFCQILPPSSIPIAYLCTRKTNPNQIMQDISTILFWTAIFLIVEPTIANLWPRIRASFLLSYPFRDSKLGMIEQYYNELDYPFRIMYPFRIKLRKCMQAIGIIITLLLLTKDRYNVINL